MMKKYIIWHNGYDVDFIEADNEEDALNQAVENLRDMARVQEVEE